VQIGFVGHRHVFGDISLVLGTIVRRSNDVQSMGVFWMVEHSGSDIARHATPMLTAFAKLFINAFQQVASDSCRFSRITPTALAELGDCYTPRHEALCLWKAAQAMV
jgi:hypothetical protein